MNRRFLLICFFLVVSVLPAFGGQGEVLFAQAVQKYQAGDYASAIKINEQLLNGLKVESPELYFNLGNSYYKQGKLGKAILNYLRAQRLAPRDADIKANLLFARHTVAKPESEKVPEFRNRWFIIFSSLSSVELKWLALAAFMFTGMVCLLSLYSGLPHKRVLLFTGLSLWLTAYFTLALIAGVMDKAGRAVMLESTDARFEPAGQATVYFKVAEGTELKLTRHKDGWVKIQRPDGRSAWVLATTVGEL